MKKQGLIVYPAIFERAEDGITITFPDLPGCISCASSMNEAIVVAKEVLRVYIKACEALEDTIADPSEETDIAVLPGQFMYMTHIWISDESSSTLKL